MQVGADGLSERGGVQHPVPHSLTRLSLVTYSRRRVDTATSTRHTGAELWGGEGGGGGATFTGEMCSLARFSLLVVAENLVQNGTAGGMAPPARITRGKGHGSCVDVCHYT